MKLILLVTGNFDTAKQVRRILHSDYSILTATNEESAVDFARSVLVDVILIDSSPPYQKVGELIERLRRLQPDAAVIALTPQEMAEREKEEHLAGVYDFVHKPLSATEVVQAVFRAVERRILLQEAKLMKKQLDKTTPPQPPERTFAHGSGVHEKTLREFSKALAASFDVTKLLNLFLDAITEMFRVSKISVLLLDENTDEYTVRVSRGLHPEFCRTLRFSHKEGVAEWLENHGRILKTEEVRQGALRPAPLSVQRELEILHAVVSVPLATKGRLVGILSLGDKVTGAHFTDEELETLFTLSSSVAVAVEDISLYQEIKYQKEFTESILERMDSGLITIDETERVTVFNPKAEYILERKATELIGKDLRVLPSPLGDMLFETMRTGKNYEGFEVEIKSPKLPLEVSTRQLLDSDGRPVGGLMLVSDISLRKDLELERGKANRLEIFNKLTGGLAHEIKNPLSSMRTCVQLLKEKHADEEFREFFQSTVTRDMDRVNELVEKFVKLTQPLEMQFATEDVHSILDQVLSSSNNEEFPRNIELSTKYDAAPSEIEADRKELSQGLACLIRNAVEAMTDGGVLTVSTVLNGEFVAVVVSDTGSGIAKNQLNEIWDPLFSTKNRGVGLGLPISQKIVAQHGGRIEVQSQPGEGTTFRVFLPISQERG